MLAGVKANVYIETTVPSYLAARPSKDVIVSAHQQLTQQWWAVCRPHFSLFVSQFVLDEVARGDAAMIARRQVILQDVPLLAVNEEAMKLAATFISKRVIPEAAATDAAHIAVATVHGMHFLLTWNCTHIANAKMTERLREVCKTAGYSLPVICTPEELMEI